MRPILPAQPRPSSGLAIGLFIALSLFGWVLYYDTIIDDFGGGNSHLKLMKLEFEQRHKVP
jgi:hypothetical protein